MVPSLGTCGDASDPKVISTYLLPTRPSDWIDAIESCLIRSRVLTGNVHDHRHFAVGPRGQFDFADGAFTQPADANVRAVFEAAHILKLRLQADRSTGTLTPFCPPEK